MLKEISMECIWCKHDFTEEQVWLILSEDTCVCKGCSQEWTDNLLFKYKQLKDMCKEYNKCSLQSKWKLIMNLCEDEDC